MRGLLVLGKSKFLCGRWRRVAGRGHATFVTTRPGKNHPRSLRFQAPARPSELFAHTRDFSRAPSLMKPWGFGNLFPAPSFLPHILLILLHTLSCSCLRLCFRKVAQVSLSAVELPDHLFVPALPASCLVFFFFPFFFHKKENKAAVFRSTLSAHALR